MNPSISEPTDVHEISMRYRTMKHDINNTLGVLMALAELSEMNPDNYPKLNAVIMERLPKMVEEMAEFGDALNKVDVETEAEKLSGC